MADLICPNCGGEMRPYERGGVTIDQCERCRGIFLDRGELERFVGAERSFYGRGHDEDRERHEGRGYEDDDRERYERHGDDDDDDERRRHSGRGRGRRESFLGELFGSD